MTDPSCRMTRIVRYSGDHVKHKRKQRLVVYLVYLYTILHIPCSGATFLLWTRPFHSGLVGSDPTSFAMSELQLQLCWHCWGAHVSNGQNYCVHRLPSRTELPDGLSNVQPGRSLTQA